MGAQTVWYQPLNGMSADSPVKIQTQEQAVPTALPNATQSSSTFGTEHTNAAVLSTSGATLKHPPKPSEALSHYH